MVYFEQENIKFDLNITGTVFDDAITTNWGPKSDLDVDNRLYEVAEKARRLLQLPVLPFETPNATVISASNHFVKMRYYQRVKDIEREKSELKAAEVDIAAYVQRLKVDKLFYMRIAR